MGDDPWLALALLPGLSPATCKSLFSLLGSAAPAQWPAILQAEPKLPSAVHAAIDTVLTGKLPDTVTRQLEGSLVWAAQPHCALLTFASADYPPLLREIAEPPPLLFVSGRPAVLKLPQLAIVGSRRPSADGLKHARRFAMELVAAGYQIGSGLALGIDTASHLGALEAGGTTVAVLGTGLNDIYPRQNSRLAGQIAERGAVISEFPLGVQSYPSNFPQRNRIISGLAHGVLVVEAAEQSGSLITARLAAEQGREVFALPGSINNPLVRGCHRLIRQGVKLVEKVEDILEELPTMLRWEQTRASDGAEAADSTPPAPAEQQGKAVLQQIGWDPVTVDTLALRTALPAADLQSCLALLELQGLIRLQAGGYVRDGR